MGYKKAMICSFAMVLTACVALTVCFMTNPKREMNFPPEEDTVAAAAKQAGLSWTVTDKTGLYAQAGVFTQTDGARRYELHDPERTRIEGYPPSALLCAAVESKKEGRDQVVTVSFTCDAVPWRNSYVWAPGDPLAGDLAEEMPSFCWEEWKQEILFAALVHGGCEDAEEVYRTFSKMEIPKDGGRLDWYAKFPGAYFKLTRSATASEGQPWPGAYSVRMELYESEAQCRKMEKELPETLQPEFPLEEAALLAALDEADLPWCISESETTSQYSDEDNVNTLYNLRDPKLKEDEENFYKTLFAGVNSGITAGSRQLSMVLDAKNHLPDEGAKIPPFCWEEWKQEILLGTRLYGGYEDEEEVYRALSELEIPEGEEGCILGTPFSGGYCEVRKGAVDQGGGSRKVIPGRYTLWISFYDSEEQYQRVVLEAEENRQKAEEFQKKSS